MCARFVILDLKAQEPQGPKSQTRTYGQHVPQTREITSEALRNMYCDTTHNLHKSVHTSMWTLVHQVSPCSYHTQSFFVRTILMPFTAGKMPTPLNCKTAKNISPCRRRANKPLTASNCKRQETPRNIDHREPPRSRGAHHDLCFLQLSPCNRRGSWRFI